jgi:N-carbamoylputrescine amidase
MEGVCFGIQICYDRKVPEGSRVLTLKEIIFMPICAATYGEAVLRGDTWELPRQCRAYESGVFVVAFNRAGMAIAGSDEPRLLVQELDLDSVAGRPEESALAARSPPGSL